MQPRTAWQATSSSSSQLVPRKEDSLASLPKKTFKNCNSKAYLSTPSLDGSARWRILPTMSTNPLYVRAGHTCVLMSSERNADNPGVLIYGGFGDAGVPLGDIHKVQVI